MQTLAAYTESFRIITPGSFLYRRVLYKYMLARNVDLGIGRNISTSINPLDFRQF